MSSGMNCEQAKEYAKTMTYRQAVGNVMSSKGIKYRKATMIKLRELAEIADRLDRKTEPSDSEKPKSCDEPQCETCLNYGAVFTDDDSFDTCMIDECHYEPKDEPQTEREGEWKWKLADNGWKDIFCSECGWTKNVDIHVSLNYDFCPGCGAKMR